MSDFISECWSQLRTHTRLSRVRDHVLFGAALSGRDIKAVNKTLDGLLKLLYPDGEAEIADEDLEWAVRLALECRRRVKEQQKRIGSAEFRNTQFSYRMGEEGVEHFVATPEIHSDEEIGADPLPPGQVWAIGPGGAGERAGLYRIEVNEAPGSGVKVINRPVPAPFSESLRTAEQNLADQPPVFGPPGVRDRPPRRSGWVEVLWSSGCEGGCSHLLLSFLAFHSSAYWSGVFMPSPRWGLSLL